MECLLRDGAGEEESGRPRGGRVGARGHGECHDDDGGRGRGRVWCLYSAPHGQSEVGPRSTLPSQTKGRRLSGQRSGLRAVGGGLSASLHTG